MRGRRKAFLIAAVAAGAGFLAYAVWIGFTIGGPAVTLAVDDYGEAVPALLAAGAALAACRLAPDRRLRAGLGRRRAGLGPARGRPGSAGAVSIGRRLRVPGLLPPGRGRPARIPDRPLPAGRARADDPRRPDRRLRPPGLELG